MNKLSDPIDSANALGVEALATFANTAFAGMERLAALNLNTARTALDRGVSNSRALLAAGDLQEFLSRQETTGAPGAARAAEYARRVFEIATQTAEALTEVVEDQVSELNKTLDKSLEKAVRSSPAGSDLAVAALRSALTSVNSAYDAMNTAAKQGNRLAEANFLAAAKLIAVKAKKAT